MSEEDNIILEVIYARTIGIDPDGPLKPMQPHKTDAQQLYEVLEEGERHTRDWCLINALKFT